MKYVFAVLAAFLMILAAHNSSAAATRTVAGMVTCTAYFEFGPITGQGATIHQARSSASEKCMDTRLNEFTAVRGQAPEGEQADMMVDSCLNITCK